MTSLLALDPSDNQTYEALCRCLNDPDDKVADEAIMDVEMEPMIAPRFLPLLRQISSDESRSEDIRSSAKTWADEIAGRAPVPVVQ